MTAWPVILVLSAATATGVVLGVQYLREIRKPVLIGTHLLLGAGALEQTVVLVAHTDGAQTMGIAASACLGVTLAIGLLTSLVARGARQLSNVMLLGHVGMGAAGFLLFLAWMFFGRVAG